MTNTRKDQINLLKEIIQDTKIIVIGAGSGLSTSAGFDYGGDRFFNNFADFKSKYGIEDMYSGSFYSFKTPEEHWAFMSRLVILNRFTDAPKPVYDDLLKLVQNKDYFVITTNVDHCFQKAGFDKKRLFYTQGDYGLFQCSKPCCQKTWDNEKEIEEMYKEQKDMKIPSNLCPKCPNCGRPMRLNLRSDDKFVEDEGWNEASKRYEDFLIKTEKENVLYLELGVGFNTAGIIKYPFWRRTLANPNAFFATINFGQALTAAEIQERSICIDGDIGDVIKQLL